MNQGAAGYNYDPSQENMDDEEIYAAMEMEQMDTEMPEGPQNYFAPMAGNVSSSQNLPMTNNQTAHLYYDPSKQNTEGGDNNNLVA